MKLEVGKTYKIEYGPSGNNCLAQYVRDRVWTIGDEITARFHLFLEEGNPMELHSISSDRLEVWVSDPSSPTPLSPVTKASLFRAMRHGEQLYSVVLTRRGEERHEILSHGYGCDRYVLAGGNAGMPYPSTFQGDPRGVLVDGHWHVERVRKLEGFDGQEITES